MLHLILGGAALQRCNNWLVFINGFKPLRAAAAWNATFSAPS
jgi:hypothetical protein